MDLGLRVLIGQRQACVSSSDTSDATLAAMAERAVAMAREAPEDPWCGLARPRSSRATGTSRRSTSIGPAPLPRPAELQEAALDAEAAAMAVKGVSEDGRGRRRLVGAGGCTIAATNGFSGGYGWTGNSVHAVAISARAPRWSGPRLRGPDVTAATCRPGEIGRRAGERAVGARRVVASRRPGPSRWSSTSGSPPG